MSGGLWIDSVLRSNHNHWMGYIGVAGLLVCLTFQACAPAKHLASREVPGTWAEADEADRREFFSQLQHYQLDYSTVNARGKGFLTINDRDNHEVSIQLRMQKDQSVWVSVTAFLGMEVGRVLLTPDSIWVINRLDGEVLVRPYEAVGDLIGRALPFAELQQLLVGNVPDSTRAAEMELGIFREGGVLRTGMPREELHFNQNFRLVTFRGDGAGSLRPAENDAATPVLETSHAYASGPEPAGQTGGTAVRLTHPGFPEKTSMTVRGKRLKLSVTMEYNRLILDQPVEMPFNIPKGYNRIH